MTKKYLCRECQEFFFEKDEAVVHCSEVHGMEYEDIIEEVENLSSVGVIEDSPKESPSDSGISEETFDLNRRLAVIEERIEDNYYTEEEKYEVMSSLMGKETGHDKKFPDKATTKDLEVKSYKAYMQELSDPEVQICRFCNREWSKISEEMKVNLDTKNECLSFADQHKSLLGKFPMIRVFHCRQSHPAIWSLIKALFKIPEKGPHAAAPFSSNPESCTKPEELSSDQSTISDNKVFLEQLSLKVKEGFNLTPEERKRMFNLWKGAKETRK